uniref:Peptidase S1 domain-containing protein n=1 Tax=Esox lucius TaxID=8010 RepID=A0AAY5KSL2_ESOLU
MLNLCIVGRRKAAPISRPYMAFLQSQRQHDCGVLVSRDFVLTAAHCDG